MSRVRKHLVGHLRVYMRLSSGEPLSSCTPQRHKNVPLLNAIFRRSVAVPLAVICTPAPAPILLIPPPHRSAETTLTQEAVERGSSLEGVSIVTSNGDGSKSPMPQGSENEVELRWWLEIVGAGEVRHPRDKGAVRADRRGSRRD